MHALHYLTLHALHHWLAERFTGGWLQGCFSQQKDELVLLLSSATGQECHLRVSCTPALPYCVPDDHYTPARSNRVALFTPVAGLVIHDIVHPPGERMLILMLDGGWHLVLKLHGRHANVLLLDAQGGVAEQFRKGLKADQAFNLPPPPAVWPPAVPQQATQEELRRLLPMIDPPTWQHLQGLPGNLPQRVSHLLQESWRGPYCVEPVAGGAHFWCWPVPHGKVYADIAQALGQWLHTHQARRHAATVLQQWQPWVQGQLKRAQQQLAGAQRLLATPTRSPSAEEIGHLLLAQAHAVSQDAQRVELDDYYNGGRLTVALTPGLSVAEQAQAYYRRHQQEQARRRQFEAQLPQMEQAAAHWLLLTQELALAGTEPTALRAFAAKYAEWAPPVRATAAEDQTAVRSFTHRGWQLWVGRHAASNHYLTTRLARPADLWLHAKDTPGSHVVLRVPPGTNVPPEVKAWAAGLAAYFSKQRNQTLATVSITPRKWVRTSRRLGIGQVKLEREEVLLVPPLKPEGDYAA